MSKAKYDPRNYTSGRDRYVRFSDDFLDMKTADTQERIMSEVTEHQYILILSGNGVGKSYGVAALKAGFLTTNPDSIVLGTSGSYSQYIDTMWKPLRSMYKHLKREHDVQGQIYGGNSPSLQLDDEWYAKVVSPRDPGELEGRHADSMLIVIEEADKKYITEEHFESAKSSITDANDKMVVICNPPEGKDNIVYEKMQSDRWHVIEFSSFESHNVLVDAGRIDDEFIPGLTDLLTVADDWESWHDEPWPQAEETWRNLDWVAEHEQFDPEIYPKIAILQNKMESDVITREQLLEVVRPGFDDARTAHEHRDDLSSLWYRRRLGTIPQDNTSAYRPYYPEAVKAASERQYPGQLGQPIGIGIDVARKGADTNAVSILYPDFLETHTWEGADHNENEARIKDIIDKQRGDIPPVAIDAVGEGSGLADRICKEYPSAIRYKAGEKAVQEDEYYNKWAEGLASLGRRLPNITFDDQKLRGELMKCARHIEYEEKKRRAGDVLDATSKSDVKDKIGFSPDRLDSAMMSCWAVDCGTQMQESFIISYS